MSTDLLRLQIAAAEILRGIGEAPHREGLEDTPLRFAKAWSHWTKGYGEDPVEVLKSFEDGSEGYTGIIVQCGIPVYSHCEHHLAPFFGVAHIGYIPTDRIAGLSKLSRVVDIFSRRLQVQERLTTQIAKAICEVLNPKGGGVILQCRHLCMESRGIQRSGTVTTTSSVWGVFAEKEARAEFLNLVSMGEKR